MLSWHRVIIGMISIVMVTFSPSRYLMASEHQDQTPEYRIEQSLPEHSKLKQGAKVFGEEHQSDFLVATVKVSKEGYVPSGVEIRARISPSLFTAKIPWDVLPQLEQDPTVLAIEPSYNLRSY